MIGSEIQLATWIGAGVQWTGGRIRDLFRGYLQRQFHAATGNVVAAVVPQAMVFGLVHMYQGWKPVVVITVLGVLYGTLVALRRDLRASMIAHAWSDIYEGYAKFPWLGRT